MFSTELYKNLPVYARLLDEEKLIEHVCNAIQPELEVLRDRIQNRAYLYNPELTPDEFLDWLGQFVGLAPLEDDWLGLGLNPNWSSRHKRVVIQRAWRYWQMKGTDWGIREAVALWLQWEPAHGEKLLINLPFGKKPTAYPPQWWHYTTSYDANLNATVMERQMMGAGDYGQAHRDDYLNLEGVLDAWDFGYGEEWSDRTLTCARAPIVATTGSGLGVERPWMHFLLREDEWLRIFPNILALNREIWSAFTDPIVFGWLSYKLRTPLLLKQSEQLDRYEVKELVEFDGQHYYDLWYYAAEESYTHIQTTTTTTDFDLMPGHGYVDEWSSDLSPCPENYLYFVAAQSLTLTETATIVEPGICIPGVEVDVAVGVESQLVGGSDAVDPTQTLEQIPAFEMEIGAPPTLSMVTPAPESRPITSQSLTVGRTPSIALKSGVDYRWIPPLSVHLHNTIWNEGGEVYYSAGMIGVLPTIKETPVYKTVRLCNLLDSYSTRLLTEYEIVKTLLPISEQNLFKLYPVLEQVSSGKNWTLLMECDDTIYLVKPTTMFWATQKGGNLVDRAQSPDLQTGRMTLYLEFLLQPHADTRLRSYALILDDQHLQTRTMPIPLAMPKRTYTGLRIASPLRFGSGADTIDDDWAISEYLPQLQDKFGAVEQTFPLLLGGDRPDPVTVPAAPIPMLPDPPELPSLRGLLQGTNSQLQSIIDRLGEIGQSENLITVKIPTGGVAVRLAEMPGLVRTTFQFSSGVGSREFGVGEIRESNQEESVELTRPEVRVVGVDEIELVFWHPTAIADSSFEVWIYKQSDS